MSAVEVCPDCDIAGCAHIRNRTGAFAALSQPSAFDLMRQRANMKEALCEFAVSTGAKFDEVTLVEKEAHEGTKIRFEYSIQKKPPVEWPAQPSVSVEELIEYLCCNTNLFTNDIEEAAQAILAKYNVTVKG